MEPPGGTNQCMQFPDVAARDKDALYRAADDQRANLIVMTQLHKSMPQLRNDSLAQGIAQAWVMDEQQG